METAPPTMQEFLSRVESFKENNGVDLTTTEDLSIAVMNLISLEEHFVFTALKIKKDEYFDSAQEIRAIRKELLTLLMPNHEGETWCISKHLLATTMRLIEVANKLQSEEKKDEAKKMFEKAYKIYTIFWGLKLKLITGKSIITTAKSSSNLEDLVNRLANCCDE